MTEVGSMPPPSGGHGRTNGGGGVPRSNGNGLANGGIEIDPTHQGSAVDFAFKQQQQRPESTMTQKSNTALFVQATNVPNSSSDSTFIHNSSS